MLEQLTPPPPPDLSRQKRTIIRQLLLTTEGSAAGLHRHPHPSFTSGTGDGKQTIMPTATEVDNRAVAIHRGVYGHHGDDRRQPGGGKWPRHNHHHHKFSTERQSAASILLRGGGHEEEDPEGIDLDDHLRRNCGAVNCVHKIGNICTDILLQPELYLELFSNKGVTSSNPLLEFCLDGGYQRLAHKDKDDENKELSHILTLCSNVESLNYRLPNATTCCNDATAYPTAAIAPPSPAGQAPVSTDDEVEIAEDEVEERGSIFLDHLGQLCQEGCDINVQGSQGYSALHFLIHGCSKENFPITLRAVKLLLSHGIDLTLEDLRGSTGFLLISNLLDKGLFVESFELAKTLLEKCLDHQRLGSVNHANHAGRTLLSHSVCHGDSSADLTRLLINNGAKVLPFRAGEFRQEDMARERNSSSFHWFLRSLIRSHSLDNTERTVRLLCQAMHQELESASQMKVHIVSTMLHLGKCSRTVGPLFVELKHTMSAYWRQPHPLRYLCLKSIRKSIGPKNLSQGTEQLKLPKSLTSYLQLD